MHFVPQQRQQHNSKPQQQQQKSTASSSSSSSSSSSNSSLTSILSSSNAASSASRFVTLSKSSSQGTLPKSYRPIATSQSPSASTSASQPRHKRAASLNSTPMIKDIEITTTTAAATATTTTTTPTINAVANAMICDATQEQQQQQQLPLEQQPQQQQQQQHEAEPEAKEKEKEKGGNGDRRDSIPEEVSNISSTLSSKLLTIQEAEQISSSSNLSSNLSSTFPATSTSSVATPQASPLATTTTALVSASISVAASSSQPLSTALCLKTQRYEFAAVSSSSSVGSNGNGSSSAVTSSSSIGGVSVAPVTSSSQLATPSVSIVGAAETERESQQLQSQSIDSNGFGSSLTALATSSTDSPSSRKSSTSSKGRPIKSHAPAPPISSSTKASPNWQQPSTSGSGRDEDAQSKLSEASSTTEQQHFIRGTPSDRDRDREREKEQISSSNSGDKPSKSTSRLSERAKKKSWYNVIYPNYKSRAQDFKKLFKEVPNEERLIVDYSCALQRDILVQGRLYVSQNYVCFHANIFSWETYECLKWKDVTAITKEKTALVIPNAISIATAKEKFFFATFAARDKSFLMLFRVWQNTLMNKTFSPQEIWKYVHNCYGEELGLTTDDEDYIDPTLDADNETDQEFQTAIEGDSGEQSQNNSSQSINQQSKQQSGNSSASSGGGSAPPRKSKTRYFFNSSKSSNLNSSANASAASGSDNKASSESTRKSNKKMKPNAKELTLSSVKPTEQTVAVTLSPPSGSGAATTTAAVSGEHKKEKEKLEKSSPAMAPPLETKRKVVIKTPRQRDVELSAKNNAEAAPTDVSDSSDSEENNIPFVATTECTSTHEGRQIVHTILPINVDTLFNLLFSKSKFLVDFHVLRKSTDLSMIDWAPNEEGQQARIVNVTVQLSASVGPKTSKVTEFQTMRECSKPGELYSIDVNSVNAGIPYADSFSVQMHFCLARTVDDHTMMSVHAQIKYKKSVWGVVKGFIEKNTWAGLEEFYGSQLHALQSETCIPPAKGKGRRPRRGTATQIRPLEEAMAQTNKTDTLDSQLLAAGVAAAAGGHSLHSGKVAQQQLAAQQQQLHLGLALSQGQHKARHKGLSVFVLLVMCLLLALNVILLLKLWKLEERIDVDLTRRARLPNLAALKDLPNTNQDWLDLLHQQELSHESELRKWQQVLQTAIELLKKTEKTLAEAMFR